MTTFYINYLKNIRGLAHTTIELYTKYVHQLIECELDYQIAIKQFEHNSNATKRIILSAYKSFYKFINDERCSQIVLPRKNKKVCSYVSEQDYWPLVGQIGAINSKKSRRLLLIIRLLYETGIRSNELLSINKQDINNNEIIIKGKGNKERIIYLSLNLKELLYEYINNGHIDGLLFKFKYKNLYKMISSLSKYLNKKISPHSFRRGFASYCINRNTNLYTLSQMMGHVDLNTTKNYICNYSYAHEMSNLFN